MTNHSPDLLLTSLQNPRVNQAVKLRERSERDATGMFLVEGYRELLRGAEAHLLIKQLYICPSLFLGENEQALIKRICQQGAQLLECDEKVFRKLSYRDRPDGLLGIAKQNRLALQDLEQKLRGTASPFLVIAEAIEKPGNLGTILRSSDAVGIDGLIVCDRCTDIFNPNVVRASIGTLFSVPTVEAEGKQTLEWLKKQGISIVAATPSAKQSYTEVDLTKPIAIALGTEQYGLSPLWMENANIQVSIPMCGQADSLNVAMAATVLMYEALRQRQKK